ncbi:MAG TPA: hypothetical protein VHR45_21630 [Thermoanaerobaculia bacterium]|nr:hypothetical protein [Thermoanaerobaculia bacterium]
MQQHVSAAPLNGNTTRFEEELTYFIAHQAELVAKHEGRTLLLRGPEVVGVFDSPLEAYLDGKKRFAAGTFMIQPCLPGPEAYTVTLTQELIA